MSKLKWFVWGTNSRTAVYRRAERFAIQALSESEAKARGVRIYDDTLHRLELSQPAKIAESGDDLFGATLHYASDQKLY